MGATGRIRALRLRALGLWLFRSQDSLNHMWALRERERETERDTETQRERKKERHTEPERENKRDRERETERLPPEHNGSIRHIPLLQHMRRNIRVEAL